jgi:acyl-CoA reductase-like NAD-dependent aldehyde dehydrogenase
LIVCAVATLCFSQAALAQSGRRQKSGVASTTAPPVTTESAPAVDPSTAKPLVPISSVIVVGDLTQSGYGSYSNSVDQAVEACVKRLKEQPLIAATGSGSLKRAAAMERAKKETEAYVLWLEIKAQRNDLGEKTIYCINYYVFMPQTAKILTEGRVFPGQQNGRLGGSVLRLPTGNKAPNWSDQLEEGGQQIADRVRTTFTKHSPATAGS